MNITTEGMEESVVVVKSAVVQENFLGEFMQVIQQVYIKQLHHSGVGDSVGDGDCIGDGEGAIVTLPQHIGPQHRPSKRKLECDELALIYKIKFCLFTA